VEFGLLGVGGEVSGLWVAMGLKAVDVRTRLGKAVVGLRLPFGPSQVALLKFARIELAAERARETSGTVGQLSCRQVLVSRVAAASASAVGMFASASAGLAEAEAGGTSAFGVPSGAGLGDAATSSFMPSGPFTWILGGGGGGGNGDGGGEERRRSASGSEFLRLKLGRGLRLG